MELVNESRKLVVQYEDFCQNPRCVFEKLLMKLGNSEDDNSYCGPQQFRASRNADVPNMEEIEKALSEFAQKED